MQARSILILGALLIVSCIVATIPGCNKLKDCGDWENNCTDLSITIDPTKSDRKVLVIGIDGFRADAMRNDITPFMYNMSQKSTTFYSDQNVVEYLTFSGPNWASLVTGVHYCKHQVTDNDYKRNALEDFPHFFKYIEEADPTIKTSSIVNWTPINEFSAHPYADYAPLADASDKEVYDQAIDMLLNSNPVSTDILFLQFDDADAAGHADGFSAQEPLYARTLDTIDNYVEGLCAAVDSLRSQGEDWMVFIVSDHGGDGTSHSGGHDNPHIRKTIFYANHPTLSFNTGYISSQIDLAPTILDYLGIESQEFNCKRDGVSILD